MALHIDLPIYKLAYDLLDLATDLTRNMPRDFKVSLGGQIRVECVALMVLIGRANAATDKVPHLDAMLEREPAGCRAAHAALTRQALHFP